MTPTGRTITKWSILLLLCAYCISMSVWAKSEADRHVCEGIDIEVKGNRNMDAVVVKGVARELARYPRRIKATSSMRNSFKAEAFSRVSLRSPAGFLFIAAAK